VEIKNLVDKLPVKLLTTCDNNLVEGAYTSDLLSDVIANAKKNQLWITLHSHQNIVAVALLKDLAGIIITSGHKPDKETIQKANEENLPMFSTKINSFELSGLLYNLLNKNE
jgi:predicted transcriptional regulator